VHPPAPDQGEQRSDAGIETLFQGKGAPETVVELEGIGLLEPGCSASCTAALARVATSDLPRAMPSEEKAKVKPIIQRC